MAIVAKSPGMTTKITLGKPVSMELTGIYADVEAASEVDFDFERSFAVEKAFSLTPRLVYIEGTNTTGLPLAASVRLSLSKPRSFWKRELLTSW